MKKKLSFGFSLSKSNKIAVGLGVVVSIVLAIILVDKFRKPAPTPTPTPTPTFIPTPTPTIDAKKLLTLTKWTTIYNGVDISKTITNVFKIRQLPDSTFVMVNSDITGTFGGLNSILADLSASNKISDGPLLDVNIYNDTTPESQGVSVYYIGTSFPIGTIYITFNNLKTLVTTPSTAFNKVGNLFYSTFYNDLITFGGITLDGTFTNYIITFDATGRVQNITATAIDGPVIGNKKVYIKLLELKDGTVLLTTFDKKLLISPNIKNTDYTLIKEILTPSSKNFTISDFVQLQDGTIVILFPTGDIYIKNSSDLTNSNSPWKQINSVTNLPPNVFVVQLLELQDSTITVVGNDGNLYFLS